MSKNDSLKQQQNLKIIFRISYELWGIDFFFVFNNGTIELNSLRTEEEEKGGKKNQINKAIQGRNWLD